ncbi:VOC family protein [Streptomyces sp. NPDC052179]|uniref:VOC family protein n=1 Tax=Streptomyces sp. NPDC052179 TaxID=3155680 RepID=UPI003446C0F1
MRHDIARLHHVGHVVGNMEDALTLYRRLGFVVPPPSYPTMAPAEGAEPEPFGAANTHADFRRSFIELATCVREGDATGIPENAHLVPLQAPAAQLPLLLRRIGETSAKLAGWLRRFEGLHILMFSSPDIDATAKRLGSSGVGHGGVNAVRRRVETNTGIHTELVRYLEIDGDGPGAGSGSTAEGRVGAVADLDPDIQGGRFLDHPNGAIDLVEVMLCVAASQLPLVQARYEKYLGRPARVDGPARVFDLDGAALTLVPDTRLAALLPDERPAALPAFVAYAVAVRDLAVVRDLLEGEGVPLRETPSGDLFVPAAAALGAAVVFRRAPVPAARPTGPGTDS